MVTIAAIEPILARVGVRNQLLVKVTTEDGIIGWGESGLSAREHAVSGTLVLDRSPPVLRVSSDP